MTGERIVFMLWQDTGRAFGLRAAVISLGNFFTSLPLGGDAYLLQFTLHDWYARSLAPQPVLELRPR